MSKGIFSATEFDRLVGISGPTRRALTTVGILRPLRTGRGWLVFTLADVQRARAWKAEQAEAKRERATA